jgi:WD40 repeat protein
LPLQERRLPIAPHLFNPYRVAVSPTGEHLALVAQQAVEIWDLAGGKRLFTAPEEGNVNPVFLAWSADGKKLAVAFPDQRVQVWDWQRGAQAKSIPTPDPVLGLTFGPDGTQLVLTTRAGQCLLVDVGAGTHKVLFADPNNQELRASVTPDGKTLVVTARQAVTLRDISTGKLLHTLPRGYLPVAPPACSADGTRLAYFSTAGTVVWNLTEGREEHTFRWPVNPPPGGTFTSFSFTPDGKQLLGGIFNGPLTIVDVSTGREQLTLRFPGFTPGIFRLTFVPESNRLVMLFLHWLVRTVPVSREPG